MDSEDFIDLSASSSSGRDRENNDLQNSGPEPGDTGLLPCDLEATEDKMNRDIPENNKGGAERGDSQQLLDTHNNTNLIDSGPFELVGVALSEITATENMNCLSPRIASENNCTTVRDGGLVSRLEINRSSSGVKRPRLAVDELQPSVHVVYSSLARESKLKLEQLLQQWSEWHAVHCSSSYKSDDVLESGEGTYFPALNIGMEKSSTVSFWIDNQIKNPQSNEFIPLDGNSAPLYDRGYSLGLTSMDGLSNLGGKCLEIVDASRCFNCGSYSHALKECPKPRDNAAVSSARKQHKSRRNQNASSRNQTRYYQNSPGGKYDGLKPGELDAETRQMLGLGELDPPPWLNRMREIGYPPGYLEPEEESQPSGITIFADEEIMEEKEEGEILGVDYPEPARKMSVEFPGINAPIPESADESHWAAGSSAFELSRSRSYNRSNHSLKSISRGHYYDQRYYRDYRDDGPPGVEPEASPSISSYSMRYGNYDPFNTSHNQRNNVSIPRSPSFGSSSDRGRRSPLVYESSPNHATYDDSLPSPSPSRLLSPRNHGSSYFCDRDRVDSDWNDFTPDTSYRSGRK